MGGLGASLDVKMRGAMTASMLPGVLEIAAERPRTSKMQRTRVKQASKRK